MKLGTLILSLLPLVGILAAPCDQCNHQSPDILASSQPLVKRVLTFDDAISKGTQRMAKMQAAVAAGVDKTGGDENLKQLVENPVSSRQYATTANNDYNEAIQSFLGVNGNTETFYNVELKENVPIGGAVYCDATYSPQTGVISADNTQKAPCIEMSDALFWEYMKVAMTHNIPVEGIKGLVIHQMTNGDTNAIITEIYTRENKDPAKDDIIIDARNDEFYAMIGTPNAAAATYMLGDHPKAIGKTTIGSIMIIHGNSNSLIFKYV